MTTKTILCAFVRNVFILAIGISCTAPVQGGCPSLCNCSLMENRKTVICSDGGRTKIPVSEMDAGIHTIIITAPESHRNNITIGRIFLRFHNLEHLKITYSNIPAIGDSTFWPGRRLKSLDLSHNVISFLRASDFNGLKNLRDLNLSFNRISATPSAPFRYLTNLSRLLLARNELRALVPRFFYPLTKLTELDLSGNYLRIIDPDNLQDVKGLKFLNLAYCQLTHIHPLLYQRLPLLEELNLENNYISTVAPEEYRHLKFLQSLTLDNNMISRIPDDAFNGHVLQTLKISGNRIETISECAFCNCSVNHLNISFNKITNVKEETFEPLSSSVEILDASGNNLDTNSLLAMMSSLNSLRIIHYTNTTLRELPPDAFNSNLDLVVMNFSRNHIEKIPADIIDRLSKLEVIDFSHNKLSSIEENTLRKISGSLSLKRVVLHNNPYYCSSCEIEPLIVWINSSSFFNYSCQQGKECVVCHHPLHMAGRLLHTVSAEELDHCNIRFGALRSLEYASKTGLYVAISIIIVIAIIIIFTIFVYKSHIAHYYTNEDRRVPCKVVSE